MQISFTQPAPELPRPPAYRLLVVAPFDPSSAGTGARPVPIDRHDFAAVLQALAPTIKLDVADRLTGRETTWWLPVQIRSLKDFSPAGLLQQVPELSWIDALRRQIQETAAAHKDPDALRHTLSDYAGIASLAPVIEACRRCLDGAGDAGAQARTPTEPAPGAEVAARPSGGDDLDRLFDLVDTGQQPADKRPTRAAISTAVAAVTGAQKARKRPLPDLEDAAAMVAALLRAQIGLILEHPHFQALEQAWRGLHWLLRGVSGDVPVHIDLLHAADVQSAAAIIRSAEPAGEQQRATGYDLILLDFALNSTHAALLPTLAANAQAAMAPALLSLADDFLVTPAGKSLASTTDPGNLLQQPVYQPWNLHRDDDSLRWVAGCFNSFVLRAPYAADERGAADLLTAQDTLDNGLWGHTGWLVARRILAQQQATDWPVPITGAREGCIEDLPMYPGAQPSPVDAQHPLRHRLTPDQADHLGAAGIIALACAPGQDKAWMLSAPSLRYMEQSARHETMHARRRDFSLSAQLLRARLVNCILAALPQLPGSDATERAKALQRYTEALLQGRNATVDIRTEQTGEPGQVRLTGALSDALVPGLTIELQLDLDP